MVDVPTTIIKWSEYYRLINSAYPPIDLFEDIADPADWMLLGAAESRSNARIAETIGNIDLIPSERRVGGAGSSYVMAPFTHVSEDKTGRFHDGTYGAFYAADSFETALFETIHHMQKFYSETNQSAGWLSDFRELIGPIDAIMTDITGEGFDELMNENDYSASQAFARDMKSKGSNGIVYKSVRNKGGICFAAFYPDVMSIPGQGRHVRYHWNGSCINMIKDLNTNQIFKVED